MEVVLDNLRSAYNVGSIIRTCDAFGIKKVYFCGITPETDNKKVKKTSLGAEKNIDKSYHADTEAIIRKLKKEGRLILGLEVSPKSIPLPNFKEKGDYVLVVGNEVSGISSEIQNICDYILEIPMQGVKESLNVATAFGIAAYHLSTLA